MTSPSPSLLSGILAVDKPEGPTSHDVVARARRAFGIREVGHAGTLDPMATGVLVLALGRATRLVQFLSGANKRYEATIRLGLTTDTWDRTGTPLSRLGGDVSLPDEARVRSGVGALLGRRDQVPPPFSAKKIQGVRAHALARSGRAVEVPAASVVLHAATILAYEAPLLRLDVTCSAGFYVRALAHELGESLGCGGCLEALRRTASGDFGLAHTLPLEVLERDPAAAAAAVVAMASVLPGLPAAILNGRGAVRAAHGNDVSPSDFLRPPPGDWSGPVRLLDEEGALVAMARPGAVPGSLHPAVVLK